MTVTQNIKEKGTSEKRKCFACEEVDHIIRYCSNDNCDSCGQLGHVAAYCPRPARTLWRYEIRDLTVPQGCSKEFATAHRGYRDGANPLARRSSRSHARRTQPQDRHGWTTGRKEEDDGRPTTETPAAHIPLRQRPPKVD